MVVINRKNFAITDLNLTISMQNYPYELRETVRYFHPLLPNGYIIIKAGFCWDGSSIPQWATHVVGSGLSPLHIKCSLPHDWIYRYGSALGITRKVADIIYRDSLRDCGKTNFKSNLEYWAVRAKGKKAYK